MNVIRSFEVKTPENVMKATTLRHKPDDVMSQFVDVTFNVSIYSISQRNFLSIIKALTVILMRQLREIELVVHTIFNIDANFAVR